MTSPVPDPVGRDFAVDHPDRLWVADITYVRTDEGFPYLAVVLDACTRRVVGWAMRRTLETEIVTAALEMAIQRRRPAAGLIHHSDHGSQYTSFTFGHRCREAGIAPSMGRVGSAYDNAMAESFFASLECELLDRMHFRTREQARLAIFDYLEGAGTTRGASTRRSRTPRRWSSRSGWRRCRSANVRRSTKAGQLQFRRGWHGGSLHPPRVRSDPLAHYVLGRQPNPLP